MKLDKYLSYLFLYMLVPCIPLFIGIVKYELDPENSEIVRTTLLSTIFVACSILSLTLGLNAKPKSIKAAGILISLLYSSLFGLGLMKEIVSISLVLALIGVIMMFICLAIEKFVYIVIKGKDINIF